MDPEDPPAAQQIVSEYAKLLERHIEADAWPARVDLLPYTKPTIKTAIRTSVLALAAGGHLSSEMREYLETAYVSLADYVEPDLARLMQEYQKAGSTLESDQRMAREKVSGDAWRTLSETGGLAGQIARAISQEAEELRGEFRDLPV